MPNRNPNKPHRFIEANQLKTQQRIEIYSGKAALLNTWETIAPDEMQIKEHDYLLELRRRVRQEKSYLLHRADPEINI